MKICHMFTLNIFMLHDRAAEPWFCMFNVYLMQPSNVIVVDCDCNTPPVFEKSINLSAIFDWLDTLAVFLERNTMWQKSCTSTTVKTSTISMKSHYGGWKAPMNYLKTESYILNQAFLCLLLSCFLYYFCLYSNLISRRNPFKVSTCSL